MELLERVADRVVTDSGYECAMCSLSFDTEYPNCPACGCSELRRV